MCFRELTDFERDALEAFAKAHGRKWRDELSMVYWYNARIWTGPVAGIGSAGGLKIMVARRPIGSAHARFRVYRQISTPRR